MSYGPCPNPRPECPYAERGCFSDLDHIVPKRLAECLLSRTYILDYPGNHQQLCRWEHDEKTRNGDEPLPSREFMLDAIRTAYESGEMHLSKGKRRRLLNE